MITKELLYDYLSSLYNFGFKLKSFNNPECGCFIAEFSFIIATGEDCLMIANIEESDYKTWISDHRNKKIDNLLYEKV